MILHPMVLASCVRSRMALETMGNSRLKEHASMAFRNVVLARACRVAAALSMLALSVRLPTMSSILARISGVFTRSSPMCRRKPSASFRTSFLASPAASRKAAITFGMDQPSCLGHSCPMRCSTSFISAMVPTFTCHLPPAAAPRCASSTGSTRSGTALPAGPHATRSLRRLSASFLIFASSSSMSTAGSTGSTAGGFHSSDRMAARQVFCVAALFSFEEKRSFAL
mmetsp:Transcript_58266/g.151401  ORF Transcript_58266/g.151401 Transcript_58266/m.151401 type:complete len:226 (-) Transcript_58266:751-1428(-)